MKTLEFVLFCLAMIFYIGNIVSDKNFKPSVVAFGIWLMADFSNMITYLDFSDRWIPPVIMTAGAVVIWILAIIRARIRRFTVNKNKLSFTDLLSLIVSVVAISIFFTTGDAKLANAMIQVILGAGFLPIIAKKSANEPIIAWLFFVLGWTMSLINTWESHIVLEWSYVLVQLAGCTIVFVLCIKWYYSIRKQVILMTNLIK